MGLPMSNKLGMLQAKPDGNWFLLRQEQNACRLSTGKIAELRRSSIILCYKHSFPTGLWILIVMEAPLSFKANVEAHVN
jgi:hypothetical protein